MPRIEDVRPNIEKIEGVSRTWLEFEYASSGTPTRPTDRVLVVEVLAAQLKTNPGSETPAVVKDIVEAARPAFAPGSLGGVERVRIVPA